GCYAVLADAPSPERRAEPHPAPDLHAAAGRLQLERRREDHCGTSIFPRADSYHHSSRSPAKSVTLCALWPYLATTLSPAISTSMGTPNRPKRSRSALCES